MKIQDKTKKFCNEGDEATQLMKKKILSKLNIYFLGREDGEFPTLTNLDIRNLGHWRNVTEVEHLLPRALFEIGSNQKIMVSRLSK